MTRDELQQRVWGMPYRHRDRTVDVCVRKVREKLDRRSAVLLVPAHALRRRLPLRGGAEGRRRGRARRVGGGGRSGYGASIGRRSPVRR